MIIASLAKFIIYKEIAHFLFHRGYKRKLQKAKQDDDDGHLSSQYSKDSNEDEGSSSEADEMAAALEAELNNLL